MLFNSIHFLIFFPIVTLLYFTIPYKYRWLLLLISSCYFYMSFIPVYILILFFTIVIDYIAGIYIEKSEGKRRKDFLILSIVANVGVLAFFKYFNFFNDNIASAANMLGISYTIPDLGIILPIGLSFHTFQAMSYTIEVYRGKQKAVKHIGIYSVYVMFYPQLVAGPIERPQNLIHQFTDKFDFEYQRVSDGLKLMMWGLFKKVVIADRLAVVVNQVYNNPTEYQGIHLIIATLFFAIQIYCDFSGYSDIAIGSAQVMGFKLMKNFDRPYLSKTINEFWKRWHISLSTWFRDYLYISLGGNRVVKWRWYFNLMAVFVVSGFWHGANWTYIIWGFLHGFYLVFGILTEDIRTKIANAIGITKFPLIHKIYKALITFLLVCFAWIFFRANNVSDAFYIVSNLFTGMGDFMLNITNIGMVKSLLSPLGLSFNELVIAIAGIIILIIVHLIQRSGEIREILKSKPVWFRWAVYYAVTFGIMFFGAYNTAQQFIYFQF